jgi:hypothetical protein
VRIYFDLRDQYKMFLTRMLGLKAISDGVGEDAISSHLPFSDEYLVT